MLLVLLARSDEGVHVRWWCMQLAVRLLVAQDGCRAALHTRIAWQALTRAARTQHSARHVTCALVDSHSRRRRSLDLVARAADGHKLQRKVAERHILSILLHHRVQVQVKHAGTQQARLRCDLLAGAAAEAHV